MARHQFPSRLYEPIGLALAASLLAASAGGFDQPMIALNHFYVTVDPDTYRQIVGSAFLKNEFAPFETRTTVRTDSTYTGAYFYGRNTYFEFFAADAAHALGASGLALGTEAAGEAAKTGHGADLITRQTGGRMLPWFYQAARRNLADGLLSIWLMEYHPDFLRQWNAGLTPVESSLRRAEVLDRYVAAIGKSSMRARALLKDVIALDIAVPPPALDEAGAHLGGLCPGCRRTPRSLECSVEGTTIRMVASGEAGGITRAVFSLQGKPPERREYRFGGRSRLSFKQTEATWDF